MELRLNGHRWESGSLLVFLVVQFLDTFIVLRLVKVSSNRSIQTVFLHESPYAKSSAVSFSVIKVGLLWLKLARLFEHQADITMQT